MILRDEFVKCDKEYFETYEQFLIKLEENKLLKIEIYLIYHQLDKLTLISILQDLIEMGRKKFLNRID